MAETSATGYTSGVFLGWESTPGVPVVVTERLPFISETISDTPTLLADMTLMGRGAGRQHDLGHRALAGAVVSQLRHALNNYLLWAFFGQPTAGVYTPTMSLEGISCTVVVQKGATSIWELTGVKPAKVTIGWAADRVSASYDLTAMGISFASAINTAAVLALLTEPSDNLLFTDLIARIGERDHVLGTPDEIGLTTGSLVMDRAQEIQYTNQQRTVIEQVGSALRMATFDFAVPRFKNTTIQDWKNSKTRLHATLSSTRNGHTRQFTLPHVTIATAPSPIANPGAISQTVTTVIDESEDLLTSVDVSASSVDNSFNISSTTAVAATGTLTISGTVSDSETVTVGADVYEIDTETTPNVTAGRIRVDLTGGATRFAQGTLTLDTQPTNGDTMTVGTQVYLFQTNGALTNVAGHIEIGTTLANTKLNIEHAINRSGTPGTGYAAATPANTLASMAAFISNDAIFTARKGGTVGNAIATTETFTAGTNVFNAATLGTTTAGVNPSASDAVTGIVEAAGARGTVEANFVDGAGNTVVVTARVAGTDGNLITTTETLANGSWGAATLTGGAGSVDVFPLMYAGTTCWSSGFATTANNGMAPVVSWTPHKVVVANAGADGITLVTEVAGASVRLVFRSPQVMMSET